MNRSFPAGLPIAVVLLLFMLALGACSLRLNVSDEGGNASGQSHAHGDQLATDRAPGPAGDVKLRMLLIGDKPADYEEVFGALNKLLLERINTSVEAEFLDWSDWARQYPLKFAAQERFDIAYTADWAFYYDQALRGGFLELTEDQIAQYAPLTWASMPKAAWEQARVNGKLYMIPNNNREITDKAVIIRDDLRKKYGLDPVDSPETFAAYVITIGTHEMDMSAYGAKPADGWKWHELDQILLEQRNEWNLVDYSMPFAYKLDDPQGQVFNVYETPEFRQLIAYYKDLADHSGWSKNIINYRNDVWQDMLAGKTGSYAHNLGTLAANLTEMRHIRPQYEGAIADLTPDKKKLAANSTQNGLAIHAASPHVERALQLIDLLHHDKQIHDLAMYGIAGKHYTPVDDDKMLSGPYAAHYTGFSVWGWNSPLNRTDAAYPQEASDMQDRWLKQIYAYPMETFVFNDAEVKSEVASVGNVMIRYAIPLEYGLIDDLDKGHAELLRQLQTAGIERVRQELQAQIDAFLTQSRG